MLSKTKGVWHANYVCNSDKHFKQSKEPILLWWTRSIHSSGSLLQLLLFATYAGVATSCLDLWYCARVHSLSIHCTIMYPIPKHAWGGGGAQSRVQRSRMLSNCAPSAAQDVGTRNHTVMYMYDVHFAVQM